MTSLVAATRVSCLDPGGQVVACEDVRFEPHAGEGAVPVVPLDAAHPARFACEYADVWRRGECALVVNPHLPVSRRDAIAARLAAGRAPAVGHVLCTSGTTRESGIPAAFFFRANRALENARAHVASLGIDDGTSERFLLPTPVWHSFGVVAGLLGAAVARGELYAFESTPDPSALATAVATHGITTLYANPTIARLLVRSARRRPLPALPTLRRVSIGSASLTRGELLELMNLLPDARFYFTYGLTEMGPRVATFGAGWGRAPNALLSGSPTRSVPIGRPIDGVECALVHDERGDRLAIVSRHAADGEWTGQRLIPLTSGPNGFVTEDAAAALESGELEVSGRVDQTIVTGGLNVSPDDVERAALATTGVAFACAVGVPSALYGEIVVLVCELDANSERDSVQTALDRALTAALAPAQLPKAVHFVEVLPKTSLGKPLRREAKALALSFMGSA